MIGHSKSKRQKSGKTTRGGKKKRNKTKKVERKKKLNIQLGQRHRNKKNKQKQQRTPPAYDEENIKNVYLASVNMTSLPSGKDVEQLFDLNYVVYIGLENCVDKTLSSADF